MLININDVDPGNAVGMKIWQCYENLPAQEWYYTEDFRIALTGKGAFNLHAIPYLTEG